MAHGSECDTEGAILGGRARLLIAAAEVPEESKLIQISDLEVKMAHEPTDKRENLRHSGTSRIRMSLAHPRVAQYKDMPPCLAE